MEYYYGSQANYTVYPHLEDQGQPAEHQTEYTNGATVLEAIIIGQSSIIHGAGIQNGSYNHNSASLWTNN